MSSEPKPFASLSSGLLARKGAARPAMRPQGFGQGAAGLEDLGWNDMGFEPPKPAAVPVRDADHDGFGEEIEDQPRVHPTGLTPVNSPAHPPAHPPVQSPVHSQHAELAGRLGVDDAGDDAGDEVDETAEPLEAEPAKVVSAKPAPAPVAVLPTARRAPKARSVPGSKSKAAFTLRLDSQRHLKLRLACAVNGRSAQQIVTDALDHLLNDMPELEAMARKAKREG